MRYYPKQNRNRLVIGQDGNALTMLIAVNLIVFVLLAFLKIIYFFSYGNPEASLLFHEQILDWVALPASTSEFIRKPWTLITHMFVHEGVWHIIANMLWLWAFGYILQDLAGNEKLIPIYLYGGFAGAVAFMAAYNLIPAVRMASADSAIGASAGVMAIAIATTVLAPNYRIFPMLNGGIPLWVITALFVIIDLATIPNSNTGGHIAHLAGAGMGFLFISQMQRGRDWGGWINNFFSWVGNLFNPDRPRRGRSIKQQLFYKSNIQPFRKTLQITQQRLDEILDKINQKGYSSLTDDEKEMLKRASKDL